MPDYNLTGLSSRSFEQLIQALSAKVIGPNLIVFGDGPDGGREATFDGHIPYPSGVNAWKGYGVLQAKFLQRPLSTTRDGKWLVQQLSAELRKFTNRKRRLRKPEYYILATNVVLSPVAHRGFKDRVLSLIRTYQKRIGIKEFDIWDYDKIRTFLDNNRDVAISYAAWITSGDVLAEVIKSVRGDRPAFDQVITNFLQKELVGDQFANLEQAGHIAETPVPLSAVFTDLPAYEERFYESPPERDSISPDFIAEILSASKMKFDPESLSGAPPAVHRSRAKTLRNGRYVLIGGPGQGKTTLGQYVCQLFRVALLRDRPRLSQEVRRIITQIMSECASDEIELPFARRFPIRIVLSDFAKALAAPQSTDVTSLLSYVAQRVSQRTDQKVDVPAFRKWMGQYPWILVLDGLDEVPASTNRDQVLGAINNFWIDATECNSDILVLATTRPQGYSNEFSPEFYLHKFLAPLSQARALRYAEKLTKVRYAADEDRRRKVYSRLERAASETATARLMRSPLQVTIMATLVDKLGQPPQERWGLFKDYFKVIYDREVERDIPAANILREYRSDIDAIHYETGLLLQVESERTGQTDAKLSSAKFAELVRAHLRDEGHGGEELERLAAQIIGTASQRLVFLVGLEANQVGFEIRSLQEFMAAEALMQGSDEDIRDRLRSIAPFVNWRNVFLFAAGRCYADRKHLRDTIQSICAELNEVQSGPELSFVLAGSQLALDLLEDGTARTQPKHYQALARVACRLLDLPPDESHVRLASMYTKDLESVFTEEVSHRLKNRDLPRRAAALICLVQLESLGVSWASSLLQSVTSEEDLQALAEVWDLAQASERNATTFARVTMASGPDFIRGRRDIARSAALRSSLWAQAKRALSSFVWFDRSTVEAPVLSGGQKLLAISFWPLRPNWMKGLQDLPNPGRVWAPYLASVPFMDNPSPRTLADALRKVSEEVDGRRSFRPLPWPIKLCLEASKDATELISLADRAAGGHLGDQTHWLAAEERWRNGVSLAEFYSVRTGSLPFSPEIAVSGFPVKAMSYFTATSIGASAFDGAVAEFRMISDAETRSIVACWMLNLIRSAGEIGTNPFETLQELVEAAALDRWTIDLSFVNLLSEIDEEAIRLIDSVGREARQLYGAELIAPARLRRLAESFAKDTKLLGVMRVLASGLAETQMPNVPLLDREIIRGLDPPLCSAALDVRFAQDQFDSEDVKDLASLVLGRVQPLAFLYSATETVAKRVDTESAIRFFLELSDSVGADIRYASRILGGLNETIRKRRSKIGEPDVWIKLGLNPTFLIADSTSGASGAASGRR